MDSIPVLFVPKTNLEFFRSHLPTLMNEGSSLRF